jgi:PEP-CTERM motif
MKRPLQLLSCALVFTSSTAFADAITGAPAVTSYSEAARAADDQSRNSSAAPATRGDSATLFDSSGASLLLMSPPQFLFVGAHPKLRGGGVGADAYGAGGGGGSLIPGGVLNGLTSGVSSGTLGNVGFNAGGGTTLDSTTRLVPIANPEPASLILLGSGLAFVARQLKRRRA